MTRRLQWDDLYRAAIPEQPAISPDGSRVAYVLRTVDRDGDRDVRALWTVATDGSPAREITSGPADTAPAFSPDGARIAFLRPGGTGDGDGTGHGAAGPSQLWTMPADGGEARQLTTLPGGAGAPVWSPDGNRIAFTAPVGAAVDEAALAAPVVIDRLGYTADGMGLLRGARMHLHVLDVATGRAAQITDGDWHAGEPAWSPDGSLLAFTAARDADADLTLRSAAYVVAAEPGGRIRRVGSDAGMAATARFCEGGTALLVVGTADVRAGNAGLWWIPLDGGDVTDLAAPLDRNVMPGGVGYPGGLPQPTADGGAVLFCVRDRGDTHVYRAAPGSPETAVAPTCLVGGAGTVVSGLAVATGAARAAVVLSTSTSYGEVVLVDTASGERTVLTDHGAALADVALFERTSREFTAADGTAVQGWLITDPARSAAGPVLLDVHGGPHNAWNGAADPVHLYHQILVAQGWSVLIVNPRGSDGYGDAFFSAGLGGWGTADAGDLTGPLDTLIAEGIADPDRLAVTGYSYGGYMTCYLTGITDRFAVAVAGGVVADLTSMYGTSDAGHLLSTLELGGSPSESPEVYAASSPIARVDRVRTPTLILQGLADDRCPVGQAEQWFTGLRAAGVPTRMVLYPGASHLFPLVGRPSHRHDYGRRLVGWLQRYIDGPAAGAARVEIDRDHWQRRLAALAERHGVPGAALGIMRVADGHCPEQLVTCAAGVLNRETGVAVTPDSVFQIGSITKVWTTTLVMQLVDAGLLDLDTPVVDVLPELRLSDPDVTRRVTMRHLLTHTSGIDGDIFTDTGRGDDCLERFVALLADAAQNHPLGATFSYCNSGFVLAGRVVEKLTGKSWDQALAERVIAPLGLTRTVTLPEEALRLRASAGHIPGAEADAGPVLAPVWALPRSAGPAGVVVSDVAGVLAFARMHLAGGVAPDGTRVLSAASVEAMQQQQVSLPDPYTLGDSWGLGWMRFDWDGRRLFGHDGNTIGQAAFLRILPEQGLVVTLLANGGHTADLYQDLYREIFAELAGVAMRRPLEPAAGDPAAVDPAPFAGTYERAGERIEVLGRDGDLVFRSTATGPLADLVPEQTHEFVLHRACLPEGDDPAGDVFVVRAPGAQTWRPATFYRLPTGEAYVHSGGRATPLRSAN